MNGVDYTFLTVDEFLALEKSGNLLEAGLYDGKTHFSYELYFCLRAISGTYAKSRIAFKFTTLGLHEYTNRY